MFFGQNIFGNIWYIDLVYCYEWYVYFVFQFFCYLVEIIMWYLGSDCWYMSFVLVDICINDVSFSGFNGFSKFYYFFLGIVIFYQVQY